MFSRKHPPQQSQQQRTLTTDEPPSPSGLVPFTSDAVDISQYEEVSRSVGFVPAELLRAQLIAFFAANEICLYPPDEVSTWLAHKCNREHPDKKMLWCWAPLRPQDVIDGWHWGFEDKGSHWQHGLYEKRRCQVYQRLVPLPALEKVRKIEESFGQSVKFFVSGYTSPIPDPFIMVRPAQMNAGDVTPYNLIFDHWDEPGF